MAEESPKSSIYDFTVKDIGGNDVSLDQYKGKTLLVVNVASKCGLTDANYKELNVLYEKYKDQGLEILAFPCNQFLGQEPGNNEEIQQTVCTRFKAEFPIFDKLIARKKSSIVCINTVVDALTGMYVGGCEPLYKYLKAEKGGLLIDAIIKWNFTKFLIAPDGNVFQRFSPRTSPLQFEKDIQTLLGQSSS